MYSETYLTSTKAASREHELQEELYCDNKNMSMRGTQVCSF